MEFKASHSAPLPGNRQQARDTMQTREQMKKSLMDSSKLRRLPDVSKDTMKQIYGFSRTPDIPKKVEVIESKPTKIKIIDRTPKIIHTTVPTYKIQHVSPFIEPFSLRDKYYGDMLKKLQLQALLKQEINEEYNIKHKNRLLKEELEELISLKVEELKPKRKSKLIYMFVVKTKNTQRQYDSFPGSIVARSPLFDRMVTKTLT